MKTDIWSDSLKRKARRELLAIANCYEPVKRSVLRGVRFYGSGRAVFVGQAHDYSFWAF